MKTLARLTVAASLALSGFLAGTALAAEDFATVDSDGDGQVTMEELKAVMPDATDEKFQEADADENGSLSAEEYADMTAE